MCDASYRLNLRFVDFLWPPESPVMSISDFFFLWGHIKTTVYEGWIKFHTLNGLQEVVCQRISRVNGDMVETKEMNTFLEQPQQTMHQWKYTSHTSCNFLYTNILKCFILKYAQIKLLVEERLTLLIYLKKKDSLAPPSNNLVTLQVMTTKIYL